MTSHSIVKLLGLSISRHLYPVHRKLVVAMLKTNSVKQIIPLTNTKYQWFICVPNTTQKGIEERHCVIRTVNCGLNICGSKAEIKLPFKCRCLNVVTFPRINNYVRLCTCNPWVKLPATSDTVFENGVIMLLTSSHTARPFNTF